MFHRARFLLLCAGVFACLMSTALGQPAVYFGQSQDTTPIPDVNKVSPPMPGDSSCWLASASNILAAAGYGSGGPAQMRAQGIYNQLTAAYGIYFPGAPDNAISYWLAWHGKNPSSPDYNPGLAYTDVTAKYATLVPSDYTFLKGELCRGQYVGVQFDSPPHAVTFVGWNDNLNQSVWTDSDKTVGMNGYDTYDNAWTPNWNLNFPGTTAPYLSSANGYVVFCPGLNKTQLVMDNYDVAWAPSPMGVGSVGAAVREAGAMVGVYNSIHSQGMGWQPTWFDPNNPGTTYEPFRVGNLLDLTKQKRVELLVDFYDRNATFVNEDIRLKYLDANGIEVVVGPTSAQLSPDCGQVLFTWDLPIQPGWEELLFPSALDYYWLDGRVASWDVATLCVPEPGTLVLILMAGLGLLVYARRRR
jgi:hypothetical protein